MRLRVGSGVRSQAIALYNDTVATGDDDRLAITNQALRELSGVTGSYAEAITYP
jgi:hypothetical protein